MGKKQENNNANNARLNRLDEALGKMLTDYEIDDYEMRRNSRGSDRLYIHLKRIQTPAQLKMA